MNRSGLAIPNPASHPPLSHRVREIQGSDIMSKLLRFACLVRVSTDRQSQQGQSLITQRKEANDNVPALGGRIAGWYGGSEHATPGHEHAEVNRLLADAAKGKIDAVHVAHPDRWSRDNGKSKVGLEILRKHKVRFFVCKQEYNLHDPMACMVLGMSAEIGEFVAANQNKKSMTNRIDRAREGKPVGGRLPYGRTYNKKTGEWGLDAKKHEIIKDCARRYLRGEGMAALAKEYHMDLASLHRILTRRCGDVWVQNFDSDRLNIHEQVPTKVPALLPPETIAAIAKRTRANRRYLRGAIKNQYLLAKFVFCAKCGRAMHGQTKYGHRYYRHSNTRDGECKARVSWPKADGLEHEILFGLFDTFGNAAKVQQAIKEAIPDLEQIAADRQRHQRLTAELAKIEPQRQKLVDAVLDGTLTNEMVRKKREALDADELRITDELDKLAAALANVPDAAEIKLFAEKLSRCWVRECVEGGRRKRRVEVPRHKLIANVANMHFERMTWEEKRQLVEMVFGGKTPEGQRLGVYISWEGGEMKYRVVGRLVEGSGIVPDVPADLPPADWEPSGIGQRQEQLLDAVNQGLNPSLHKP
jgi:DNA invertase Pin-like site-specific DNA recombinase